MKKLVGILLIAALLAFGAAALAQADLEAIQQANFLYNVPDAYPSCVLHTTTYDVETGEVADRLSAYLSYQENTGLHLVMTNGDGDVWLWGGGCGYGYVGQSGQPYVYGFVGGAYEETMLALFSQNVGEFFDNSVLVAEETSADGKLLLTVETPITEATTDYEAFAGATLRAHYTVHPDSLMIEASDNFIVTADGTEKRYLTSSLEPDATYQLPFDLDALRQPKATRQIHVLVNPGTDEEFDDVLEAPLNVPMVIYVPAGYELFDDPACTLLSTASIQPDQDGNYPESSTLYCGPLTE